MFSSWLQRKTANWARRRHGEDQNPLVLHSRRIYILPTRAGLVFAALVFTMFLGSMNYGSSLGFALTFLLVGVGLVAMHHTHRNLAGTSVHFLGCQPVFAGKNAHFQVGLTNPSAGHRYELMTDCEGGQSKPADLAPGQTETVSLVVPTRGRGLLRRERFRIRSRHPAGLFRAWSWAHLRLDCIVYPAPATDAPPLPFSEVEGLDRWAEQHGEADFAGLRAFANGDPPRRIAWKAYARSEDLLVKQFSGSQAAPTYLDWALLSGRDEESRLSILARWCLDAHSSGQKFGLKIPNQRHRAQQWHRPSASMPGRFGASWSWGRQGLMTFYKG